jgi:hypothetical protein
MNVFSNCSSLFGIILGGQSNQVILDLESGSKGNSVLGDSFGLLLSEV